MITPLLVGILLGAFAALLGRIFGAPIWGVLLLYTSAGSLGVLASAVALSNRASELKRTASCDYGQDL
jgi:hypothetical protein